MAIPQPPLYSDYVSLGATSNTNLRNNALNTRDGPLNQYYDKTSSIPITAAERLVANSAAWSAAPSTMPGHATGTTIEVHSPSPPAESPSPHRASTRTPSSTSSHKSSRSRTSTSSKSSAPSDNPPTNKRTSRSAAHSTSDGSRRDKFLERNRIAASKCRQRKKEWVSGLEDAKNELESQNSQLQMEYNGLLGEVSRMKNQIMAHATCHDPNIDKWIDNEARRFVQAPEGGGGESQESLGYGGFSEAGAPPFPMDYQFDEGSRLSPTDTVLSADMSGYLKDAERPVLRVPEAVSG